MLDFVKIEVTETKRGLVVSPGFIVKRSKDLMIRGKAFYAIWDEAKGVWSTEDYDVQKLVDEELRSYLNDHPDLNVCKVDWLSDFRSNKWSEFLKYCKSLADNYHELDGRITFLNDKIRKTDYISKRLEYSLEEGSIEAYDTLMSVLYEEEEREKLEWAIGSIVAGDSVTIQKFIVLYGGPGTGKSTVLNIIQNLFDGYYSVFDSRSLGSSNNAFALEDFSSNPLVSIQHDGDLSRIEDNTKLNSIVSHESMMVNEKFKSKYRMQFRSFLFMGTNKPVKITDSKSGILRRLIDVSPTGEKFPYGKFKKLMDQTKFELGAIAWHCLQVYQDLGKSYYDNYIPTHMIGATNDFYNFIEDNYFFFSESETVSLASAWSRYKEYCSDSSIPYVMKKRDFKEELRNYFDKFYDRYDTNTRSVYAGFKQEKFDYIPVGDKKFVGLREEETLDWIQLKEQPSLIDEIYSDCKAQYVTEEGAPRNKWAKVETTLSEIDTSEEHYILPGDSLIVVDFDLKNEQGEKSLERNLAEANKWPPTYVETSKSGGGIHLHYIYDGDPTQLSQIYDENIEIKVFVGNSALRRKLTVCNDLPIAHMNSGLPLKRSKNMLKGEVLKSERSIRAMILRNLKKEIHADTTSSINFIYKILEDAYNSGVKYDVTDMRPDVQVFANNSTNKPGYCLKMVSKMKFKSEEPSENVEFNISEEEAPIVFYDVEVFPNLFVVVWKRQGAGQCLMKWVNPTPQQCEQLTKFRLVGFNNRLYDNHILYARMMGYSEEELFRLSQRIINEKGRDALFGEAYNLSYTDIYDFLSASNKTSLKKWEIKLGIHHQELGLPWDQSVPKELWDKVAQYCANDVLATEATWDANQEDWKARQILAAISGLTVNDTTNQHTTRIIVGTDRNPQDKYIYTDLSTIFPGYEYSPYGIDRDRYNPGTKIVSGKSIYRGEDPGEGGHVYAEPGIYVNVAVLDIASMHPHSLIRLKMFGEFYTMRFKDIVDVRIYIKHGEFEKAKLLLDGKLAPYLDDPEGAKELANALKTAINSVYGLTSAKFPNKLRDPRNVDNIVAKYGALFMIDLKHKVQELGYTVVHIKTDSIKIAEADEKIIQFVMDYGKEYGFTFEHEDTYSKICLVNESTYIARYAKPHKDKKTGEDIWWAATGAQFQVPYVFKTLFSHKEITFDDLCETKSVTSSLYLDFNENLGYEEHDYRFVGKVGSFCPVIPGCGGGILLREKDGKYHAATGTKKRGKIEKDEEEAYRWMESEMVENLGYFEDKKIDMSYYRELADDAIETINKFGNFEFFASDHVFTKSDLGWKNVPDLTDDEELPFDPDPPEKFMNLPVGA